MHQLAIILSILTPIVFGQCHNGWIQNGTSCYFFNRFNDDSFGAAEFECSTFGGYIVEVDTREENQFIIDTLTKLHTGDPRINGTFYYLGGSDMEVNGQWSWIKNRKEMTFTDWAPGEPNDYRQHEDCLAIGGMFSWHWVDAPCNARFHFICEVPMKAP